MSIFPLECFLFCNYYIAFFGDYVWNLILYLHGLHLATEENRLPVMKFRWSFFLYLSGCGWALIIHTRWAQEATHWMPVAWWSSSFSSSIGVLAEQQADSLRQGEIAVDDGARIANGAVTELALAASSSSCTDHHRRVVGHGDCSGGGLCCRWGSRRLLRAGIAASGRSGARRLRRQHLRQACAVVGVRCRRTWR
jgi:hypothetical protein